MSLAPSVTCVTGENNSGKSNFIFALRLLLDSKLGIAARSLTSTDFHADYDLSKPTQIVIAAELKDVVGAVQLAFAGIAPIADLGPTIALRFRPGQKAREEVDPVSKDYNGPALTIDDYEPELVFCQDADPRSVEWYEPLGSSLRFSQLQEFTVECLPALRDVEQDLRQARTSPLEKLISIAKIPSVERDAIEQAFLAANKALRGINSIQNISTSMQREFGRIAGEATSLTVDVGVADPSFSKLTRTLSILFQSDDVGSLDLSRNGLGVNNLLYISMITDYFAKRIAAAQAPGQLFLIDEPEAHLHPQAQRVLYAALEGSGFQTVLATHSTHVASQAALSTHISLVREPKASSAANLSKVLSQRDAADVERYLDATRSGLLFSRKVLLVEGPAEAFVIPPLVKAVLGLDLDRLFISVVAIHGTHFAPYAALFGEQALKKKCAIVCDGDRPG